MDRIGNCPGSGLRYSKVIPSCQLKLRLDGLRWRRIRRNPLYIVFCHGLTLAQQALRPDSAR